MLARGEVHKFADRSLWLPYFITAGAALLLSARLTLAGEKDASVFERGVVRNVMSGVGLLFALIAFNVVLPDPFVPVAWAAFGLAILEAGNAFDVIAWRLQGQAIAALAALSSIGFTLADGQEHRIVAISALIVILIGFRFRSIATTAFEQKLPQVHLWAASILAAGAIFQEVSGRVLTVAWGAEALLLLGAGFVLRERPLRLQGLLLFLICILKLFLYDLRNLETPYRIMSFIALGLVLLGVSWIYTRFREHLQKLF